MTTNEFDRHLKQALSDAIREDWAAVEAMGPALDFTPSAAHRRRVRRVLSNHKRAIKRSARPRWKRLLTSAACLLLTLTLTFGAVMAVNPAARAAVIQMVRQWFATYTDYRFSAITNIEVGDWTATYLPEGFERTQATSFAGATDVVFENQAGLAIYLSIMPMQEGFGMSIDNEHSTLHSIKINGNSADLYVANTTGATNQLIWANDSESTAFLLYSTISPEELVLVAEGLELSPEK